jgi:arylsulfatase A-like enzyme
MSKRPNLLFILTDDQGAWAMGCAGNAEVRTPNLDRLAAEGTRFENFFCTSPVCSPARASILTGRIPSQHGVHDFLHWGSYVPDCPADSTRFLEGMPAYAETLAREGYATCFSGKWHVGYSREPQCGFQHWRPMPDGGCDYYRPPIVENGEVVMHEGDYDSDLYTDNALAFLDAQAEGDAPFCVHVHYTAPHSPWGREQHPKELWDDYHDNCPFQSVPADEPVPMGYNARGKTAEERREALAGYFAAITAMDANVGRLLDWLDEHGEAENTLVVFMSDNGMNMGHHGFWGKGNASWPQNMFDTSVKVPCLIRRPGHVPAGMVDQHLLSQYDWLPTLMDYLDMADQTPDGLPGSSFALLLRGDSMGGRESVVVFDEYGPVRMIRSKEWKLVWRYPAGPHELYHLAQDPEEKVNLFDYKGNGEVVERMRRELDEWFERYADPVLDGRTKPVTGRGQLARADRQGAFRCRYPNDWRPERP